MTALSRDDVSAEALAFRNCRQTYVAGVPVVLIRISFILPSLQNPKFLVRDDAKVV